MEGEHRSRGGRSLAWIVGLLALICGCALLILFAIQREHAPSMGLEQAGPVGATVESQSRSAATLEPDATPVASAPTIAAASPREPAKAAPSSVSGSNEWTMVVRVVGEDNQPISRGVLEYCYGRFNVGTTRGLPGTTGSVTVDSESTNIKVPQGTAEFRATALCADERLGTTRVNLIERARSGPPRLIDVVVRVSASLLEPSLSGEIRRLDGEPLPADLEAWLVPLVTEEERAAIGRAEPRARDADVPPDRNTRNDPMAPRPGRRPIACIVDRARGRYRVGPLTPGLWSVRLTSAQLAPASFALGRVLEPASARRLDLVLDRGIDLRLTTVYDDGIPAGPGITFSCRGRSVYWIGSRAGRREEAWEKLATTADDGTCLFSGVPVGDVLFLGRDTVGEEPEALMRVDVPVDSPRTLDRRIVITRHPFIEAWGPVPDPREFGIESFDDVTLGIYASDRRGTENVYRKERSIRLPVDEENWRVRVPSVSCGWDLLLERGGSRISTVASVPAFAPTEVGPLILAAFHPEDSVVTWRDAPLGWTLRMCSTNRDGPIGPCVATTLRAARGETRVVLADSVPLEVCVLRGEKTNLRFAVAASAAADGDGLDLHARHALSLSIAMDGQRVDASGELLLASTSALVEGVVDFRVSAEIEVGKSVVPIPLPPGRYYYRFDSAARPGVVCGWLNVPLQSLAGEELNIDWRGRRVKARELAPGAPDDVELVQLGGQALSTTIPVVWRRFNLSAYRYEALENGTEEISIYASPTDCVFRAVTSTQ